MSEKKLKKTNRTIPKVNKTVPKVNKTIAVAMRHMDPDDKVDFEGNKIPRKLRFHESVFPSPNVDEGTEFDDKFFTALEVGAPFDFSPRQHHLAQRYSLRAYRSNVRAKRSVELLKNFILGDGVRFKANDPKVDALLRQHWDVNEWDDKIEERVRSLGIFGEQLYPVFINDKTGLVRLSSVSPFRIIKLLRDKDNAELLTTAIANLDHDMHPGKEEDNEKEGFTNFEIIRPNDKGDLKGNAFYFAINRIAGATRGIGDLVESLDWLDGNDNFAFSLLERANLASNVVYDLTVTGATTDTEVDKKIKSFLSAMRSGATFGHNENVALKLLVPELAAGDAETVNKIFLRQIQAGTGWAGLFFGDAEDLTRASASELSLAPAKMVQNRQSFVRRMIGKIFQFQIEQARDKGQLQGVEDFTYDIELPKVFLRDMSSIAKTLVDLTTTLTAAETQEYVTNDEASMVYRTFLEEFRPLPPFGLDEQSSEEIPDMKEVMRILDKIRNNAKRNGDTKNPQGTGGRESRKIRQEL